MVTNELNKVTYIGDGSQTSFEITFPVLTDGNKNAFGIAVALLRITGETVYLVKDTDYSVSGKNIVAVVAPAVSEKLMIYRQNEQTQKIHFINNDAIDADILELALDKLTMSVQELSERTNRVVTQEITDGEASLVFPPAAARANAFLSFDENGNIDVQTGAYPRTWYIGFPYRLNEICQHKGLFYKSKHGNNSGNEPPAIGETSSHWDEFKTGGNGGMPNYIDDRAGSYTAETGFSITTDTSSEAINKDGCIKVVKDAVNRDGTGWHQDVLISDTDLNSLLQLDFWLKSTDADKLNVRIYDLDADPDVVIFDSVIVNVAEKNPVTGIYYFSQDVQTSGSKNYRTQFYMNSSSAAAMTFWTSEVSLGQPYRFTAPSHGYSAGDVILHFGHNLPAGRAYSSGPEISQADYPEAYAEIGDMWEAERIAAGWPAPTAGYFYPGPSAGYYFRDAMPPENVVSSAVDYAIQAIPLSIPPSVRPGTPIIISGNDLPNELTSGTQYYLGYRTGVSPAYYSLYSTEALAIASVSGSGRVAFTDSGSGTFQLIQVGGYLGNALEEHKHITYRQDTDANDYLGGSSNPYGLSINQSVDQLNFIRGVLSASTSNETRPDTAYCAYTVVVEPVRDIQFMKKQTSRNDIGEKIDSSIPPDSNGIGENGNLVFDSSYTHNWSDYSQLIPIKTELIAANYIEDLGATFKMRDLSYTTGWVEKTNLGAEYLEAIHGLGISYEDLDVKLLLSPNADGSAAIEIVYATYDAYTTGTRGYTYRGTDNNTIRISFGVNGVQYIPEGSGYVASTIAGTWYYNIKVSRKDSPQPSTYAYLRTKSLSAVILAEVFDDTFFEHEITTATNVIYTLANLDQRKEYTFNRNGAGAGALQLTGDIYWPDGAASTDFALEGNGQITLFYACGKWRIRAFSDSGNDGGYWSWQKDINGVLVNRSEDYAYDAGSAVSDVIRTIVFMKPFFNNHYTLEGRAEGSDPGTGNAYLRLVYVISTDNENGMQFIWRKDGGYFQVLANEHLQFTGRFRP